MSRREEKGQSLRPSRALRRLSRPSGVVGGPGRHARPDGSGGNDVVRRAHRTDPGGRRRSRASRAARGHRGCTPGERRSDPTVADDHAHAGTDGTVWNSSFSCRAVHDGPVGTTRDGRPEHRDHSQLDQRYRWEPGNHPPLSGRLVDHRPGDQLTEDDDDDRPPGSGVRRLPRLPGRCVGDVPERQWGNRFSYRYLDGDTDTFAYDHMHKPACIKNWRIWHIAGSYR